MEYSSPNMDTSNEPVRYGSPQPAVCTTPQNLLGLAVSCLNPSIDAVAPGPDQEYSTDPENTVSLGSSPSLSPPHAAYENAEDNRQAHPSSPFVLATQDAPTLAPSQVPVVGPSRAYNDTEVSVPPQSAIHTPSTSNSPDPESSQPRKRKRANSPDPEAQRPKRGRPPKLKPALTPNVSRPVGRPPGSGPKQKAAAHAGPVNVPKRPVGRPRKGAEGIGRVTVRLLPGKILMPATTSSQPASTPPLGDPVSFQPPLPPVHAAATPSGTTAGSSPPLQTFPSQGARSPHAAQYAADVSGSIHRIIPEEDPQRAAELVDDDDDPELSGDGVGTEDEFELGADEANDEHDPEVENGSTDSPRPRPRRMPMPSWLQEDFSAKVAESSCRDANGLPPLYANHQSFWFPQPAAYFVLQQPNVSPQKLYRPRFSLWDPECLCPNGIHCPNCGTKLYRHGNISNPRRCVSFNGTFYVIGYRYRCPNCVNPKSKKHTVTFPSWDSRILAVIPPELAAEFPARLSHRSGMSTSLFSWMRSCFQNGMGAKQFSDALRVQHVQAYDELQLQYLDFLVGHCNLDEWRRKQYESFRPFDDRNLDGPRNFVPSGQWVRDMYDRFIEEHRFDFDQHTALLTAEICALDHSHKIVKHILKVNGEEIFTALLTVTNEKGEIRSCNLVATKSHSQFELALKRIQDSLKLYGHILPMLFFTDNMADKQFLEKSFPSLLQSVVPVEKYSHLDALTVPRNVSILTKNSVTAINDAMRTILDDLPPDNPNAQIAVGFDSEWNVEVTGNGHVYHRGKTAIVQIAYKDRIYILQIEAMLAGGSLPHHLKLLLSHPNVLKVGRLVDADLKYLHTACQAVTPFVGALDLAKYAKERRVIKSARCSLADLCATVLGRRLNKNVPERISEAWEAEVLTPEQLNYAACDAYACLAIYEKLSTIDIPRPLPSNPAPTTSVLVYSSDNTVVIAHGRISSHMDSKFDGINVTKTRIVVDVFEVLVPGAIVSSHNKRALSTFGPPPFSIICQRNHLRVFSSALWPNLPGPQEPSAAAPPAPESCATNQDGQPAESDILDDLDLGGLSQLGDIVVGTARSANLPLVPPDYPHEVDQESAAEGEAVFGLYPDEWDDAVRSRVLKDVFHIFNMIKTSSSHGLRVEFARQLSNAIFIPDEEDKRRIIAWGANQNPPLTFEKLKACRPAWLWRRCKRIIPPPKVLYPAVKKVFQTFGPLKDATTSLPLFNHSNWKTAGHILDLIRNGFVSDPPGIALYTCIGIDQKDGGLPIYRCSRGTNFTEGGVHAHLRSHLPTSGASVRHTHACLLDFVLRHNLLVGTFNTTGQHYRSHFSIWLTNKIQERTIYLEGVLVNPIQLSGWVNGNLYLPTSETLGILPVPPDIQASSSMSEFNPSLDKNQAHSFLAEMQGTRKPVLPIHTNAEKQLFRSFMQTEPVFNSSTTGPLWKEAVKLWNRHAEIEPDVFYKLVEQLKVYYAGWKTSINTKETLTLTHNARKDLNTTLNHPSRFSALPPVPERPRKPNTITRGVMPIPDFSAAPATPPPIASSSQTTLDDLRAPSTQVLRTDIVKVAKRRVQNELDRQKGKATVVNVSQTAKIPAEIATR